MSEINKLMSVLVASYCVTLSHVPSYLTNLLIKTYTRAHNPYTNSSNYIYLIRNPITTLNDINYNDVQNIIVKTSVTGIQSNRNRQIRS